MYSSHEKKNFCSFDLSEKYASKEFVKTTNIAKNKRYKLQNESWH